VLLASCNGTLLIESDGKLGIAERGGGWLGTALFVAVLLAVIPIGAGATLLATTGELAGLVPVGIGGVAAGVAGLLFKRKRRDDASTHFPAPWLVFDLRGGVVRDGAGAVLGELARVRVATEGQLASSSKMLVAYCPSKVVIARGTPFGDSVADIERALKSRGIGA
jgi:LPXTG-motif cell wall-anchored protein